MSKYDNDVERRNAHPMRLPQTGTKRLTIPEKELLRESSVMEFAKRTTTSKKVPKKGVPWDGESKSVSPRSGTMAK